MARVLVAAVAAVLALAVQAAGSQAPEWHRPLVGIPLAAAQSTRFHHFVNSTLPREQSILLAFTEQNVLASLDPITGSLRELLRASAADRTILIEGSPIDWRHHLTGSAAAAKLHACDDESEHLILVVSAVGTNMWVCRCHCDVRGRIRGVSLTEYRISEVEDCK